MCFQHLHVARIMRFVWKRAKEFQLAFWREKIRCWVGFGGLDNALNKNCSIVLRKCALILEI